MGMSMRSGRALPYRGERRGDGVPVIPPFISLAVTVLGLIADLVPVRDGDKTAIGVVAAPDVVDRLPSIDQVRVAVDGADRDVDRPRQPLQEVSGRSPR